MATWKTVTVKASGGDYTSLNSAISTEQTDITAQSGDLVIELYPMRDTSLVNNSSFAGYTTDTTHRLIFRSNVDNGGVFNNDDTQIYIHNRDGNVAEGMLVGTAAENQLWEGVQCRLSGTAASSKCMWVTVGGGTGTNIEFDRCFFAFQHEDAVDVTNGCIRFAESDGKHLLRNCVIDGDGLCLESNAVRVDGPTSVIDLWMDNCAINGFTHAFRLEDSRQGVRVRNTKVTNCLNLIDDSQSGSTFHSDSDNNFFDGTDNSTNWGASSISSDMALLATVTQAGNGAGGSSSALTGSHTTDTGTDLLVVTVHIGYSSSVREATVVTFDGDALTELASINQGDTSAATAIWYMTSPAAKTATVSVGSFGGAARVQWTAFNIDAADTTTPFSAFTQLTRGGASTDAKLYFGVPESKSGEIQIYAATLESASAITATALNRTNEISTRQHIDTLGGLMKVGLNTGFPNTLTGGWNPSTTCAQAVLGVSVRAATPMTLAYNSYASVNVHNHDLHTADTSDDGYLAGKDLTSDTDHPFATDFDQKPRTGTWDIGPHHLVVRDQEGFQWREDDGSESGATDVGAQDANITIGRVVRRLRTLTNLRGEPDTEALTIEYREVGDADTEWRSIPI